MVECGWLPPSPAPYTAYSSTPHISLSCCPTSSPAAPLPPPCLPHRAQVVQHHQQVVGAQGGQGVGVVLQAEQRHGAHLRGGWVGGWVDGQLSVATTEASGG